MGCRIGRAYRAAPGVRLEVLPGVGHTPMFEAPDTTADLVTAFASTLPGTGRSAS